MTRAAKITYAIALLTGLSVGSLFGFKTTSERLSLTRFVFTFPPESLNDYAYIQYKQARTEDAKNALRLQASFLEQMEHIQPDRLIESDLGTAYTRLAVLEEKDGNVEQYRLNIEKARDCIELNDKERLSDADIKAAAQRMDELVHH